MRTQTIRRSIKNKWVIPSILALVIVLSGTGYYYYMTSQSGNESDTPQTAAIGSGDIILSASGLGSLVPSEEISIGFKNGGQVAEVLVSLGDSVKAGQVLARLESKTIELAYAQAEANLAALASPANVAKAEQAVQEAKESLVTARDDLQYLLGPDLLNAQEAAADAQAELEEALAVMEQGPSDANKQQAASAEAALTKAEEILERAQNDYDGKYILQMFVYPIRNDHGTTVRRELIAPTDVEISVARAAYDLAKVNLMDAQNYLDILKGNKTADDVPASSIASLTETTIAYEKAKANLDATELIAPIGGTITSISLNDGEDVGTSAVITISNLGQPYTVDAYLDETDWDKAKAGYAAAVTFDLLPDETYSGTIKQVYPILDDSSGVAMVHILVELDADAVVDLPSGSSASVEVVGGEALDAILVPISAVREVENGNYIVYLIKNGEPVKQEVEIGLQDILYAEVKSGLQVGDVVLADATIYE